MKTNSSTLVDDSHQTRIPETQPSYKVENTKAAKQSDKQRRDLIHTTPGLTKDGKPFDHVVKKKVANGEYWLQTIPANITGKGTTG